MTDSNSTSELANVNTTCCVVGGGPAGMILGYLLARAGVDTLVLEKHDDFLRDFRGDTVHPSTLRVMQELGLLEEFLKLPHQKLPRLSGYFGSQRVDIAEFTGLPEEYGFVAMMPQWDFLQFLLEQGRRLPHLSVRLGAQALELVRDERRVTGVRVKTRDGLLKVQATLTVGADGRHSIIREQAHLPLEELTAPIDVLWFRVKRDPSDQPALAHVARGIVLVTLDRGDYYQCAYVIAKGAAERVKARGLPAFREEISRLMPSLAPHAAELESWDQVKLLSVTVNRLKQWSLPGLLCIGDAAHAMSPVGGVGINLAIQDAVAAANLLAEALRERQPTDDILARVQRRRELPTRITQAIQVQAHERILAPALQQAAPEPQRPLLMQLTDRFSPVRRLFGRVVGLGIRPEHVRAAVHG